jgi:hypothetical protein
LTRARPGRRAARTFAVGIPNGTRQFGGPLSHIAQGDLITRPRILRADHRYFNNYRADPGSGLIKFTKFGQRDYSECGTLPLAQRSQDSFAHIRCPARICHHAHEKIACSKLILRSTHRGSQ